MIPKLHAKGSSFKGAADYLLHDKDRAETNARVAWTDVRNLAVNDPHTAWKIMVATSQDQHRLKERAGIPNTGRKSDKCVLHFTLSWHPEQEPSRTEMIEAADGALNALGADKHQALIVSHNDEDHPHVHLLVNRISPEDGRLLSSSKEKLNLSKWAQDYEERTGIYCDNRIINNEMRDRGEYVRGRKDQARHIFEAQQRTPSNDNDRSHAVWAEQRVKDHALSQYGRKVAETQLSELNGLGMGHSEKLASIETELKRSLEKTKHAVEQEFRPERVKMRRRQRKEKSVFEALETSFFGKASNIVRTVQVNAKEIGDDQSGIITRSFKILTNAGARKAYFERAQLQERARFAKLRQERTEALSAPHRETYDQDKAEARSAFLSAQDGLLKKHNSESADLRSAWKVRSVERLAAYDALNKAENRRAELLDDYRDASTPEDKARNDVLRSFLRDDFNGSDNRAAPEQDNDRSSDPNRGDDDIER